jgi:hypothetical protein
VAVAAGEGVADGVTVAVAPPVTLRLPCAWSVGEPPHEPSGTTAVTTNVVFDVTNGALKVNVNEPSLLMVV